MPPQAVCSRGYHVFTVSQCSNIGILFALHKFWMDFDRMDFDEIWRRYSLTITDELITFWQTCTRVKGAVYDGKFE